MSNSQGGKREIIRLSEFPRSRTPEPAAKRQGTSRSNSKTINSIPKDSRLPGQRETVAGLSQKKAAPTSLEVDRHLQESPGSSERSSEPLEDSTSLMHSRRIDTAAAESREQEGDEQGRVRTPVVWGQGIPLRPAMTIRRNSQTAPSRADKTALTTNQIPGIASSILTGILPGHASVTDGVTRLQRERVLACRRIDELHEHYKKEMKSRDDSNYKMSQWNKEEHQN